MPLSSLRDDNAAARLASLLDSAMDAILTVDADQRIVLYNRAAEKIFGWHGMGEWVIQGIATQDTNIIAAVTVFTGAAVLLAGLLSDVIYAALDPRVRVT